jgi:hypothetical protein
VISAKVTLGREQSITCFVNSTLDELAPKFKKFTLKRYCSFGINKPWFPPALSDATVMLNNDCEAVAIFLSPVINIYLY